jgi:hypothetical protein
MLLEVKSPKGLWCEVAMEEIQFEVESSINGIGRRHPTMNLEIMVEN